MKYTIEIRKFGRVDYDFVDHTDSRLIALAIAADAMNSTQVSNCRIIVLREDYTAIIDLSHMLR